MSFTVLTVCLCPIVKKQYFEEGAGTIYMYIKDGKANPVVLDYLSNKVVVSKLPLLLPILLYNVYVYKGRQRQSCCAVLSVEEVVSKLELLLPFLFYSHL